MGCGENKNYRERKAEMNRQREMVVGCCGVCLCKRKDKEALSHLFMALLVSPGNLAAAVRSRILLKNWA